MERGHLVNCVQLFRGSNKTITTYFEMYIAEVGLGPVLELSCLTLPYERTAFAFTLQSDCDMLSPC